MAKPTPIAKRLECSECGQLWETHMKGHAKTYQPTIEDCVRALRAELARRPIQFSGNTVVGSTSPGIRLA